MADDDAEKSPLADCGKPCARAEGNDLYSYRCTNPVNPPKRRKDGTIPSGGRKGVKGDEEKTARDKEFVRRWLRRKAKEDAAGGKKGRPKPEEEKDTGGTDAPKTGEEPKSGGETGGKDGKEPGGGGNAPRTPVFPPNDPKAMEDERRIAMRLAFDDALENGFKRLLDCPKECPCDDISVSYEEEILDAPDSNGPRGASAGNLGGHMRVLVAVYCTITIRCQVVL